MAKKNTKVGAGVGAGVLAAGAAMAAAGYYFYASKDAKQNRKIAAKWAGNLKNDVVKQAKKVQNIDKAQLAKIIDQAAAAYETVRSVDKMDLQKAAKELKMNWQELAAELTGGMKKAGTSAKKTVSNAKKSAKKAVSSAKKTVKKARR
ncbi:MAG: hypothetical protein JWM46_178 [Candidatus Kaiserbacteria bacterium]|nr:hypothetical protein [Candidatus Kaiserbacteria bacterium]